VSNTNVSFAKIGETKKIHILWLRSHGNGRWRGPFHSTYA